MDSLQHMSLQPETLATARSLASELHRDVSAVIEDAAQLGLDIIRQELFFANKQKSIVPGTAEEALAILDRAGTEPPMPGDELPENYRRPA